jgi:carbon monoxide dehydrogenase subunit G
MLHAIWSAPFDPWRGIQVLLEVKKSTDVDAAPAAAWALIRDVRRLSGCIPGVTDLAELEPDKRYSAVVAEKLGPFKLQIPVQIELQKVDEPRQIVAELTGNESKGQARVRGTLDATLEPLETGTRLELSMHMEVLGRLAALGAGPMRRRTDEIFNEFVRRISAELSTK